MDILVNNAAFARSTRFPELSVDEWREALEINLTAPFLLTKAVLPQMTKQRYGRIINVSSSAGRTVSTLGGAHYTASKAGLLGLTRASAKELGKFGIRVNAICPGMINTELTRENASSEVLERLTSAGGVQRTERRHIEARVVPTHVVDNRSARRIGKIVTPATRLAPLNSPVAVELQSSWNPFGFGKTAWIRPDDFRARQTHGTSFHGEPGQPARRSRR